MQTGWLLSHLVLRAINALLCNSPTRKFHLSSFGFQLREKLIYHHTIGLESLPALQKAKVYIRCEHLILEHFAHEHSISASLCPVVRLGTTDTAISSRA
jgi:hypothetical protein